MYVCMKNIVLVHLNSTKYNIKNQNKKTRDLIVCHGCNKTFVITIIKTNCVKSGVCMKEITNFKKSICLV